MTRAGDMSRCMVCGGKIVAIHHPGIVSLTAGLWVHKSWLRRSFPTHRPAPPGGGDQ